VNPGATQSASPAVRKTTIVFLQSNGQ